MAIGRFLNFLTGGDTSKAENHILGSVAIYFTELLDEVTGEWRRLHNKEHYALYWQDIISVIKSRRLRWTGHVARIGERNGAYRVFVRQPEGRRPLERPRRRWKDNIKMDLQEVGRGDA